MIVVIEGADGCGKTSVAESVAKRIGGGLISFPNDGGYTGPAIREYLRKEWSVSEDENGRGLIDEKFTGALALQGLMVANRMELMPRLGRAAWMGTEKLVLARYWQSAWVYGQLDGLDPQWLLDVHAAMVRPNVSILLRASAEVCMERRAARDGQLAPERYEGKLDFTKRIVGLYDQLWDRTPKANGKSWVIDAERPFEEVVDQVMAAVGVLT